MSLFRDESPIHGALILDPYKAVTGTSNGVVPGSIWYDSATSSFQTQLPVGQSALVSAAVTNITPVTATNPSSQADLMTFTFPAGSLNALNRTIYFWGAGNYTTAGAQTPTFRLRASLGGVTVLDFTSGATTASVTKTWNVEGYIIVSATGATGTVEAHGIFNVELGAGAAGSVAETSYNDAVIAASSSIDFTAADILKLTCLFSSSNGGNSIVQRQFIAEIGN